MEFAFPPGKAVSRGWSGFSTLPGVGGRLPGRLLLIVVEVVRKSAITRREATNHRYKWPKNKKLAKISA